MRNLLAGIVALNMVLCPASASDTMRLAVTTSFHNSGLSDVLLPAIAEELAVKVHLLVVGTGQALRLGRNGDVDAVLVHARDAEERFVEAGYGVRRCEIMYNDFVILGPRSDPAKVASTDSAVGAFRAVAEAQERFVSRGDESGTHLRELAIWSQADLDPQDFGSWYSEVGASMGASLNTASGLDAYILADRASWLTFGNKGDLAMLYSGDSSLHNQYAYLRVNPALHPHVKAEPARRLENWLSGPGGKRLIDGYRLNDQPLFTPNASCTG